MRHKVTTQMRLVVALALALVVNAFVLPQPAEAKTYSDATGGFVNETAFVTSAAYTANIAAATPIDVAAYASGVIVINVTAVSGTSPTLLVNFLACATAPGLQNAPSTALCSTTAFLSSSSITATGLYFIKVDHFPRWVSLSATIGGTTPSFTFTATGYFKPTS